MLSKDEYLGDITAATGIYFGLFLHFFYQDQASQVCGNLCDELVYSFTHKYDKTFSQSVTAMDMFKT